MNEDATNVQVSIRFRPALKSSNESSNFFLDSSKITDAARGVSYVFDKVYDPTTNNIAIFDNSVRLIVDSCVDGFNGTIFAYGQTASGKTYTMQGKNSAFDDGLIALSVNEIFNKMKMVPERHFEISATYLEVYNEKLIDLVSEAEVLDRIGAPSWPEMKHEERTQLLSQGNKGNIVITEDKKGSTVVHGARVVPISCSKDVTKLLRRCQKVRHVAETALNERSSRSHSILSLRIDSTSLVKKDPATEDQNNKNVAPVTSRAMQNYSEKPASQCVSCRVGCLHLVDLAGSEGISRSRTEGVNKLEGSRINQSLLALTKVISQIVQNQQKSEKNDQLPRLYVNYRDSKLTRLLSNSLGGNSKTSIICCVSPELADYRETVSTLEFAARAKCIRNKAKVNVYVSAGDEIVIENSHLKNELYQLKLKLLYLESIKSIELEKTFEPAVNAENNNFFKEINTPKIRVSIINTQKTLESEVQNTSDYFLPLENSEHHVVDMESSSLIQLNDFLKQEEVDQSSSLQETPSDQTKAFNEVYDTFPTKESLKRNFCKNSQYQYPTLLEEQLEFRRRKKRLKVQSQEHFQTVVDRSNQYAYESRMLIDAKPRAETQECRQANHKTTETIKVSLKRLSRIKPLNIFLKNNVKNCQKCEEAFFELDKRRIAYESLEKKHSLLGEKYQESEKELEKIRSLLFQVRENNPDVSYLKEKIEEVEAALKYEKVKHADSIARQEREFTLFINSEKKSQALIFAEKEKEFSKKYEALQCTINNQIKDTQEAERLKFQNEIFQLSERLYETEAALDNSKNQLELATKNNASEVDVLQKKIKKLQSFLQHQDSINEQLQLWKQKFQVQDESLLCLKKELKRLKIEYEDIVKERNSLKINLETATTKTEAKNEELKMQLSEINEVLKSVQTGSINKIREQDSLNQNLNELLNAAKTELTTKNHKIEKTNYELKMLKSQLDEKEKVLKNTTETLNSLLATYNEQQSKATKTMLEYSKTIELLQLEIKELKTELKTLKEENTVLAKFETYRSPIDDSYWIDCTNTLVFILSTFSQQPYDSIDETSFQLLQDLNTIIFTLEKDAFLISTLCDVNEERILLQQYSSQFLYEKYVFNTSWYVTYTNLSFDFLDTIANCWNKESKDAQTKLQLLKKDLEQNSKLFAEKDVECQERLRQAQNKLLANETTICELLSQLSQQVKPSVVDVGVDTSEVKELATQLLDSLFFFHSKKNEELSSLRKDFAVAKNTINLLNAIIEEEKNETENKRQEYRKLIETHRKDALELQQKISSLIISNDSLKQEQEAKRKVVQDLREEILNLQTKLEQEKRDMQEIQKQNAEILSLKNTVEKEQPRLVVRSVFQQKRK